MFRSRSLRLTPLLVALAFATVGLGGCSNANRVESDDATPRTATTTAPRLSSVRSFSEFDALAGPAPAATNCDALCAKRRREFAYVVYVGKQIYCYWDRAKMDTGTDFDALASRLTATIRSGMSTSQYFIVLRTWASAFHDGHVNVMQATGHSGLEIFTAPIRIEILAPATNHEKAIISAVGDVAGLAVGDEILTVNGVPTDRALDLAVETASSGSTARMRRFFAGRRLVDVLGVENGDAPFTITVKPLAGGDVKTADIYRNVELEAAPAPPTTLPVAASGAHLLSARVLPGNIGYFRLNGFGGTQGGTLIGQLMDRLAGTRALILDLRSNGGGDLSGDRILERLATKAITRYKRSERVSDFQIARDPITFFGQPLDATGMFTLWHDLVVQPVLASHYAKPVFALISPYCFSACDTFAAALKTNHLAKFVGEPTGGGTGTPQVFDLPYSSFQFRYSVIRGLTSAGTPIEGVGTAPDYYMEPTAIDRAKNRDAQLAQAIALANAAAEAGSPAPRITPPLSVNALTGVTPPSLELSPTRAELDLIQEFAAFDERPSADEDR